MDFSFRPVEERFRADLRPFLASALREPFFDNVRVPRGNGVGCIDDGWNILADRVLGLPR